MSESYQSYDWRISLRKAARTAALVALLALADHFADKAKTQEVVPQGAPWSEAVTVALVGAATWVRNWLKHA